MKNSAELLCEGGSLNFWCHHFFKAFQLSARFPGRGPYLDLSTPTVAVGAAGQTSLCLVRQPSRGENAWALE